MHDAPPIWRYLPARREEIALLTSIPHTGTFVPAGIARQFSSPSVTAAMMTDWHLHELYSFLPELGIDVIHATHHRFVVDLNRPADSRPLYPGRFETTLVPTETFQGEAIWRAPPSPKEVAERVEKYHRPYHAALERRLREKVAQFGRCYLIDLHSVESRASRLHGELHEDVFLGDRDGTTCDAVLTNLVRDLFRAEQLAVSVNQPYKGGFITAHYCSVDKAQTLQIEMCQRLYMREGEPEGAAGQALFGEFRRRLERIFAAIADAVGVAHLKC
ncbi:MAG TPA: N-formylglutamate amidohydrolase [Steroidobacteraceae bacterium]|nr:N-formylglutamate amidohydrolase [Steroidobacteraceae bacterium]